MIMVTTAITTSIARVAKGPVLKPTIILYISLAILLGLIRDESESIQKSTWKISVNEQNS